MAVEAGGDARCGIGTRLRSARERKGLTILQAAEKLHLDAKVLESLESEDFGALGAPVYVRGHLRHYAELVGELPAELKELYANTIKVVQPDLTDVPKEVPADRASQLVVPALFVLVGFALVGTVWWALTLSGQKPSAVQVRRQADNTAMPAGAAATPPAEAPPLAPATHAEAVSAVKTGTAAPAPAPAQPKQAVPGAAGGAAPRAKQAELTLKFSAESWAEVYDASGQRLFYDIGAADSVRTLKGTPPLHIVLGNAPGVAVEVNGRPAAITRLVRSDGSAQFLINRSGRAVRAKPAADGG
jgi:cytoskeleton protein RodZ